VAVIGGTEIVSSGGPHSGGGGSGTVSAGTPGQLAIFTGGTTVAGDTKLTDNGTTLAFTGTGGITGIITANLPNLVTVVHKSASYLALSTDGNHIFVFTTSGPGVTLTLPAAPPTNGWWIFITVLGTNSVAILPNGLNLDGAPDPGLVQVGSGGTIYSDGSNYFLITIPQSQEINVDLSPVRLITDTVSANSSSIITSATANFTQADVGALLINFSPAFSNALGLTTVAGQPVIVSVQSATQATMNLQVQSWGPNTYIGHDNSAALNAGAVAASNASGILIVPPGQFLIGTPNLFNSASTNNFSVKGAGKGQSHLIPSPFVSYATHPLVNPGTNITWQGLDVNWLGLTGIPAVAAGASGLFFATISYISDSQFLGWNAAPGNGISTVQCDSDYLYIENVDISSSCYAFLIHSLNLIVDKCSFHSSGEAGAIIEDLSYGKFSNTAITGNTYAVDATTGSGGGIDNFFVNCYFAAPLYDIRTDTSIGGAAGVVLTFVNCLFSPGGSPNGSSAFPNASGILNRGANTINVSNSIFIPTGTGVALNNTGTFIDGGGNVGLAGSIINSGTIIGGNFALNVQIGSVLPVVIQSPTTSGSAYNFNLPITAGTAGQVLTSQGGGSTPMTWTSGGGASASSLTLSPINLLAGGADAINSHTAATYLITHSGVDSITIAAPTIGTDDGKVINVTSNTPASHTITFTGGTLRSGSAGVTTITFAAFAGSSVTFYAYQGVWYVLSQNLIASYS
jgi:hypothetical protein